jgi:HK97 gp10 family phage protein
MNIKVEIKNLPAIRSAFAKSPRLMTKNLQQAISRTALIIGSQSRRNTPVRTGRLRASTYERFFAGLKAEVGTNTNYDFFVHEGTRFMRGRPYMRLAVEQRQNAIDMEFQKAVQTTLNEIAGAAR